jgi:16S rRNA (guanine(966)-N(2))-methyltransferase RsmD
VRIIGGRLRGRKLRYTGQWFTRPMKDRVRQALFNILGPAVVGKWAIDLFAGTGALAIEALSRGASRATFIEQHVPTAETIRQNLADLGLLEQSEIVAGSAMAWAQQIVGTQQTSERAAAPWLVFCSPPWEYFVDRRDEMLDLLRGLIEAAPAGSVFVAEWDKRFEYHRLPNFQRWDIRAYLPAMIGIYIKRNVHGEPGA